MTGDWFTGLADASARVECGSETHVVRWRAGRFRALAHPVIDLEAERALAALGGQSCRCAELLEAWERHGADPRVLLMGPRAQDSRLALAYRQMARAWHRPSLPPVGPGATAEQSIAAVLDLGGELPHRFVATVAAALADQTGDPALAPTLQAALYGRVLASLDRWTDRTAELELVMDGGERSLMREVNGDFRARLPFHWITEVWARRLDVIDGELTLSAHPGADGTMALVTVDHAMTMHTRTLSALATP